LKSGFSIAAAIAVAATFDCSATTVHRCFTANLGVSYQEAPCEPGNDAGELDLSNFPEVNAAARDRLLQREAALDRRLEAERERLSREAMTRIAARAQFAAAEASAAPAAEPAYYAAGWPMVRARAPFGGQRIRPRVLQR
jgi:AraC-like DNA-binding protein